MIFGSNPTYLYGEAFKYKFATPDRAYKMEPLPVACAECPARLVGGAIEIFFAGPIFNTYVVTDEDRVCTLRSYDGKLTIIKKKQPKNRLLTVKTVREDDKVREVELYRYDDFFPGFRCAGQIELVGGQRVVHTKKGSGPIVLQNNTQNTKCECILYKIENGEYSFVEINNPVTRCTVTVDKDMKGTKIVSNGGIKGVLLDCRSSKTQIDVYTKRVCLGSYIFTEDIKEGTATVKLQGTENGQHKVSFKGFTGVCCDAKVSDTMKGVIYDIQGDTFRFRQVDEAGERCAAPSSNEDAVAAGPKHRRTDGFEEVAVEKRIRIDSEDMIANDQFRAIDYIKNQMDKTDNLLPLINKYIGCLAEKDHLCLFYLKYVEEKGMLCASDVSRMLKAASPNFPRLAVDAFDSKAVLEQVYKRKQSKACFLKLLGLAEDKVQFIKEHRDFTDCAIEYIYKNLKNPRVLVESIIDLSFRSWVVYLRHESGPYKRGLFRRLVKANLKKDDAKRAFKLWLEFEESVHGNVEEVKEQAKAFVDAQK